MTRRGGHLLFWLMFTCGLAADFLSKHFVFAFLATRQDRAYDVWPGVFMLSVHYNTGGPFSLLSGHNAWLIAVTIVALLVIIYLYVGMVRRQGRLALVSLSMIAAGAFGNLVDRLAFERVRDFLNFYIIRYPVFNVADVLITVGAGLLVIELLRSGGGRHKSEVGDAGASD